MRLVAHLSMDLGSTAFFLIAVAILVGGCNDPRSKNDGDTTAITAVSRLSQTLVGKRITIRGKLHLFKCGQAIELDDEEVVCLEFIHPKSVLDDPYDGMYEKPVEATGTLRFFTTLHR